MEKIDIIRALDSYEVFDHMILIINTIDGKSLVMNGHIRDPYYSDSDKMVAIENKDKVIWVDCDSIVSIETI